MANKMDIMKLKVMDEPVEALASFSFFSPNFNERLAAAPLPISPAIAFAKITKGNITLVAAFPKVPTPLPINIWSTIL